MVIKLLSKMGKRKYRDEEDGLTKRNKKSSVSEDDKEQPQSVQNSNRLQNQPLFDIKHFRKELAEKQGQTMGKINYNYLKVPIFYITNYNAKGKSLILIYYKN